MNKYAPTGNILDDFLNGCRKGLDLSIYNVTPNFILAFALVEILNITGLMAMLTNVLNPIMGIFGLPGASGVILVTGWLSIPAAVVAMIALASKGILNGYHMAILIPTMYCIANQIQSTGRILSVIKTPTKYFFPIYIVGFITMIIMGLLMRIVVASLF